ncbi:MAG: hypothetical protein E7037_03240 [Verrucomicrobia bacterium]|nr:hypothetical protein [Verrucomicrobiota bacterium]
MSGAFLSQPELNSTGLWSVAFFEYVPAVIVASSSASTLISIQFPPSILIAGLFHENPCVFERAFPLNESVAVLIS